MQCTGGRAMVSLEMKPHNPNDAEDPPDKEEQFQVGSNEQLHEMIAKGSLDFDSWTSLISEIEKTYPDTIEKISLVYDSFLSKYPLCHVYWRRYADHYARICSVDKAVEIFERAVQSATYCVGVWIDYCSFGMSAFEDPSNLRRLFRRGLAFVGKDYLSHTLWDKYLKFEYSQQQWSSLAHIYIQTLRFPTKKLHGYYDNFKELVAILKEEVVCQDNCSIEVPSAPVPDAAGTIHEDEISRVIKDIEDPSDGSLRFKALQKYTSMGDHFYQKACQLEEKIKCFESCIRRSFFHVKPLDENQLKIWNYYLDFIENQEDFDWAVKLYERCLIPCANYPEYWMRYVQFMETKGGRELANFSLHRATQTFLKNVPAIHIFNARFKEQTKDVHSARAAFLHCDTEFNSDFIEYVIKEANMEKRLGNLAAASNICEKALEMAAEQKKLHSVPNLYIYYSRLKYMITASADAARDVIIDGIQLVPHCRLLLEELIRFVMVHEGSRQVNVVDSIIGNAISPGPDVFQGLSTKDREEISSLYLEFVDLCGTIHDVNKAWNRHMKLFPHLTRTSTSYENPTGRQLLTVNMEKRRTDTFVLPNQPSRSHGSGHLVELPLQEQVVVLPENHAMQPDQVLTDQIQPIDDNNSSRKRMQQLSLNVSAQSGEDGVSELIHDSVRKSEDDSSGPMNFTHDLVNPPKEDAFGLVELTQDLVQQSEEDSPEPDEPLYEVEQPSGPIEPLESSQEYSNLINIQQEKNHESAQHLKPDILDCLSLNSQRNESQCLIPVASKEQNIPQELFKSSGSIVEDCQNSEGDPSMAGPNSTPAADYALIQNESDENALVSPSSAARQKNPTTQKHSQLDVPPACGESWHQLNHVVQNQYQPGAAQGNLPSSHAQAPHTSPQQTFVSQAQMNPPPYTQSQMSPYSIVSSQQLEHTQNSQEYNQMLQRHYQQQHQQLLQQQYQQQLLQMPPPYLQQQYYVQQQQLQPPSYQPQQQPYLLYMSQEQQQIQQLAHLQLQQGQQLQQFYQLEQTASKQHQEGYQQQTEHGYQLLLQQYQLQQQQGAQAFNKQQQPQQQQTEDWKYQQQITSASQNRSHYQQGQDVTPPHRTGTTGPSEALLPEQQSPQIVTHPHTAGASGTAIPPHEQDLSIL